MNLISSLFILLMISMSIGLAILFFGSLVALLAALGRRQWPWVIAICVSWPIAATIFSRKLLTEQKWVFQFMVGGWMAVLPMLLFLLVAFINPDISIKA